MDRSLVKRSSTKHGPLEKEQKPIQQYFASRTLSEQYENAKRYDNAKMSPSEVNRYPICSWGDSREIAPERM